MISAQSTSRPPAQMVWASVWMDHRGRVRRSPLVIMTRDPNAPRNGYTAESYCQALEEGLLRNYHAGELFMQDNARIHTAARTREFLAVHKINNVNFPPYSLDLNPIKHLWWALKRELCKRYPNLAYTGRGEEAWDQFCTALKDCWRRIPDSLIQKLILSMPRRIQAVRAARGYQTKY
jgi:transposase